MLDETKTKDQLLAELHEMRARVAELETERAERNRAEEPLQKRIAALGRPLDDDENLSLEDLFDLEDLQRLQDLFAEAWGVAALITRLDGTPITRPSNFTRLCGELIRGNAKGRRNCCRSDAVIGRHNPSGPVISSG